MEAQVEKILNCPVCESTSLNDFAKGLDNVELFEMLKLPSSPSSWSHCTNCNHVFLNPKFSKQVESRLYGEESIYRKYSIGNQTLPEYFATIDNTMADKNAVHGTHLYNINKIQEFMKLPAQSKILDFGAGFGAASSAFLHKKMDYQGYEFDEFCLKIANEQGRNVKKSVDKKPDYDLVYSAQVFEHISKPAGAVRDLVDFAKEGACVFINVPTHQYTIVPPENLANGGHLCMNWGHFHSYALESLKYLMEDTKNLEIVGTWFSNNDINVLARKKTGALCKVVTSSPYSTSAEKLQLYFSKYIIQPVWLTQRAVKSLIKKIIGR